MSRKPNTWTKSIKPPLRHNITLKQSNFEEEKIVNGLELYPAMKAIIVVKFKIFPTMKSIKIHKKDPSRLTITYQSKEKIRWKICRTTKEGGDLYTTSIQLNSTNYNQRLYRANASGLNPQAKFSRHHPKNDADKGIKFPCILEEVLCLFNGHKFLLG